MTSHFTPIEKYPAKQKEIMRRIGENTDQKVSFYDRNAKGERIPDDEVEAWTNEEKAIYEEVRMMNLQTVNLHIAKFTKINDGEDEWHELISADKE